MRRKLLLVPALVPALALAAMTGLSGAADPTVDAASGAGGYYWNPAQAGVAPGGSVTFRNSSAVVPHGVSWTGGPVTPSCAGVPIDDGKTSWSGSCSFAQPGTYTYVCYVHPTEMKGTVTVGEAGTQPPPTQPPYPGGGGAGAPEPGGGAGAGYLRLNLAHSQRGRSVRGTVESGQSGRLTVDVLAARAKVSGGRGEGTVAVGHLVKASVPAGRSAIVVALTPSARSAVTELGALPVTVTATLVAQGKTSKRTKAIVMKGGSGK